MYVHVGLYELDLVDVLFLLAVVAGQDAVGDVEVGGHGLVVGDTLGVVTLHDALDDLGGLDGLLLDDLIVADDVENDFWGNDGETGYLVVGEKLVRNLDDALHANLLRGVVVTDGDGGLQVEEPEEVSHLIGFGGGYVVDDGALLDGGNQAFFLVHIVFVITL